jgi:ferrous iron transport protein A
MELLKLKVGQQAIVKAVLSEDISAKLTGLGVVKGQKISYLYKAPFGGPIAYQVGSYVLALRTSEAKAIDVEILGEHE